MFCAKKTETPKTCKESPCGNWSTLAPMLHRRTAFGAAAAPAASSTSSTSLDTDPRIYVAGGIGGVAGGPDQVLDSFESYNPNDDIWTILQNMPLPLAHTTMAFVPDYSFPSPETTGYLYVAGAPEGSDFLEVLVRWDVHREIWEMLPPLPPGIGIGAALQYLDDVGGPLAELFIEITGVNLPACTDTQTLWLIGGQGSEQKAYYIESGVNGELFGDWVLGPDLPLLRQDPLVGRTFWRDAGITSYGISSCATAIVAGGTDESGAETRDVQLLVRRDCNWTWVTADDNLTNIPQSTLTLALPVANGAVGTEQWPETLATGGRPILFGGNPAAADNGGTTQYAQFRFNPNRLERDPCLKEGPAPDSAWNLGGTMPGQRTGFRAAPLSQANSSFFGGRRVSRFVCLGGVDSLTGQIVARNQLYQLPVPPAWLFASVDPERCCKQHCQCDCSAGLAEDKNDMQSQPSVDEERRFAIRQPNGCNNRVHAAKPRWVSKRRG